MYKFGSFNRQGAKILRQDRKVDSALDWFF